TMQFNGANVGETVDISANGDRVRFSRDVANITMDSHSVEHINFAALGGSDHVVVNDLSGTGTSRVNIDLAATAGGASGDGQADAVTVNGSAGADMIVAQTGGGETVVSGLAAEVHIRGEDANIDQLQIN